MLKELPDEALEILLKLYNKIYLTGRLPDDWKHAIIIPLSKPSKEKSDPNSYRPISLTSCVCKLMEKLVNNRLTYYIESNNLFTNAQTGFRKGRSTLDQIVKLHDTIHKFNKVKGATVGVFLDFEKAYDMVWRSGLLYKVKQMGIVGNMFAFIENFVKDRTFQVQVGGELSDIETLKNGVPQGSIISPTLFLIMINDMTVNVPGVELSLFADDSATYKSGKNIKALTKDIQLSLDNIVNWCDKWGFKISTEKSCGVIFTNKVKSKNSIKLKIKGKELKMEPKVKFLGMIFDARLTWSDHIKYVVDKCKSALNLMRCLSGSSWGASKKCLLSIYKSLIRSHLDYGSVVLDTAVKTSKAKLDTVQCKALRICCGAMAGTPLSALQSECGEPPLALRRNKLSIQYLIKVKATSNHPSTQVDGDHWVNHYGKFKPGEETIFCKTKDFFDTHKFEIEIKQPLSDPPWNNKKIVIDSTLSKRFSKKESPEIIMRNITLDHMQMYEDCLEIYTDGSKDAGGRVGAAVYIPEVKLNRSVRLTDKLSVYTAELYAINESLDWVIENLNSNVLANNRDVVIFSDSLSSLVSLEGRKSKTRPNLVNQIILKYNKISNNKVTIAWIPSHVNINGNEVADSLAKQALQHDSIYCNLKFEARELDELVDEYIMHKWQNIFDRNKTGLFNKAVNNNKVNSKIKYENTCRGKEVVLSRLRLGRCRLNKYLHDMGKHGSGLCDTCKVPETVEHYVMSCPASKLNSIIKQGCKKENIPCELNQVLSSKKIIDLFYPYIDRPI
jgi:ribonuclease HI